MKKTTLFAVTILISGIISSCSNGPVSSGRSTASTNKLSKPTLESKNTRISDELSRSPQSLVQRKYFDWPIDEARLTRAYSADPVKHPKRRLKKRSHWGIDLASAKGTPIYASHHGVVAYTGREFKGYGKMLLIEGENGWATVYAHLDKILAKEGQKVRQGDMIGLMGKTGRVTGVHLHFEIRQNKEAYDPLLFLPNGEKIASKLAAKNHHTP